VKHWTIPIAILLLAALACGINLDSQGDSAADAVQATIAALGIQQTAAALEGTSQAMQNAQDAAQQATSVAATVAAMGANQPTQAPAPTQAPPTQAAPPTQPPLPTETPIADGSLVRAAWDPAYSWGAPHDYDDFESGSGLFGDFSSGASRAWYGDDGRFHITFTSRGRHVWAWSFLMVSEFYADVIIFNGPGCVPGDSAGMIFRGEQIPLDIGYMFGINCNGEYNIQATGPAGQPGGLGSGGVIWPIINGSYGNPGEGWKKHEAINTGPGAVNRIGVWGDKGDFDFYINGQWVDQFSYWSLPAPDRWPVGQFALYLGTAQKNKASVSFDEFSVWEGVTH